MNTEFDESISFSHYCAIYRKFGVQKQKPKIDYIPFIMTLEFTYSYSEELRVSREIDKQSIENITPLNYKINRYVKIKKEYLRYINVYAKF